MEYPQYSLEENIDSVFEFTSTGRHGKIRKIIRFAPTANKAVYNMGFGNKIGTDAKGNFIIDDTAVNNNDDRNKILSTVAKAIFIFTERNPEIYVFLPGRVHQEPGYTEWLCHRI